MKFPTLKGLLFDLFFILFHLILRILILELYEYQFENKCNLFISFLVLLVLLNFNNFSNARVDKHDSNTNSLIVFFSFKKATICEQFN